MRTRTISITAIVMTAAIGAGGLGCKRSAESRAEEATTLVRAMHQDLLEAQKKIVTKFKALPEADTIRIDFDKNLNGWSVSEKNLSEVEETYEKSLIGFQKDSKGEALIGELRLYAKKIAKGFQGSIPDFESRESKAKRELAEGKFIYEKMTIDLDDAGKKTREQLLKIIPLHIEFEKEAQRIATEYEVKLAKLLS